MDIFDGLLIGVAVGWAITWFERVPTARAVDAWVRDKCSVWF